MNFRFQNLRKPLNLEWSKNDLMNEDQQIHFAVMDKNKIIGSFCLKKIDNKIIKLRQMAIQKISKKRDMARTSLNSQKNMQLKINIKKLF